MVFKSKASLERFTGYEITESVAIEGYYIDKRKTANIVSEGPSDKNEKMFYDAYITALKYYDMADKGKIKKITLKLINDINKGVGYEGALREYYAALAGIRNLKPESVDSGPMNMVWSGNTVPL